MSDDEEKKTKDSVGDPPIKVKPDGTEKEINPFGEESIKTKPGGTDIEKARDIYYMKKEELQKELANRDLNIEGTVEELRKRLSQAVKEEKARGVKSLVEIYEQAGGTETPTLPLASKITADQCTNTDPPLTQKTYTEHSTNTGPATMRKTFADLSMNAGSSINIPPRADSDTNAKTSGTNLYTPATVLSPATSYLSDAEIMNKVRKWNVRFDKGQDPLGFLERIEELAECYEIPVARIFRALPELLTKNALAWYRNNRADWDGWDDFVRAFKEFYLPPRYHVKLAEEIRTRVQRNGEKAKEYITALQSLMRWCPNMSSEERLERIYDNLRLDYRFYIRRSDFQTLGELVKMVEEYELLRGEEQKVQTSRPSNSRPHAPERSKTLPIRQGYSREECCWRCGQRGHRRPQCQNRAVLFCSRCGKQGTLTRECTCTPRQNEVNGRQRNEPRNPSPREMLRQEESSRQGNESGVQNMGGRPVPPHPR